MGKQKFFAGAGFSSKPAIIPWKGTNQFYNPVFEVHFETISKLFSQNLLSFSDVKLEGYNQPDLEKVTIEASCVTGFEGAAADEVGKKLNGENIIEIMGRVLFDVPISDIKKVLELRTVDNIWVIHGATIGKLKRKIILGESSGKITEFLKFQIWILLKQKRRVLEN